MDIKTLNLYQKELTHRLGQLSWAWFGAVSLLVLGVAFELLLANPMRKEHAQLLTRANQLKQEVRSMGKVPAALASNAAPDQIAKFYGFFPTGKGLPETFENLLAAAKAKGLMLNQGEYRVEKSVEGRLLRYRMILPVKGPYPSLRGFVADSLVRIPNMSLENIKFQRQKIGESKVEATLWFTLYLNPEAS
jgi:hypothetical protein